MRALLDLAYIKRQVEFSFHDGILLLPGQHIAVPSVTSGGSRRRECLEPAKKQALCRPERCAAPVQPCLSLPEPPPPGGKGISPFPALVPGAGTLPVGVQGRSALLAPTGAKSRLAQAGVVYFFLGSILSKPQSGRRTSGMTTEPSACWKFSMIAISTRSVTAVALIVCTKSRVSPSL